MSHWYYNGSPITDLPTGSFGFVYEITNNISGKRYIGRKYATKRVKTKIKTKSISAKNKKKTQIKLKSSDWETYQGSCKPLLTDIIEHGVHNFSFNIIAFGYTRGQVNYLEEYIQFMTNCVLSQDYYNNSIGSRGYIAMNNNQDLLNIVNSLPSNIIPHRNYL